MQQSYDQAEGKKRVRIVSWPVSSSSSAPRPPAAPASAASLGDEPGASNPKKQRLQIAQRQDEKAAYEHNLLAIRPDVLVVDTFTDAPVFSNAQESKELVVAADVPDDRPDVTYAESFAIVEQAIRHNIQHLKYNMDDAPEPVLYPPHIEKLIQAASLGSLVALNIVFQFWQLSMDENAWAKQVSSDPILSEAAKQLQTRTLRAMFRLCSPEEYENSWREMISNLKWDPQTVIDNLHSVLDKFLYRLEFDVASSRIDVLVAVGALSLSHVSQLPAENPLDTLDTDAKMSAEERAICKEMFELKQSTSTMVPARLPWIPPRLYEWTFSKHIRMPHAQQAQPWRHAFSSLGLMEMGRLLHLNYGVVSQNEKVLAIATEPRLAALISPKIQDQLVGGWPLLMLEFYKQLPTNIVLRCYELTENKLRASHHSLLFPTINAQGRTQPLQLTEDYEQKLANALTQALEALEKRGETFVQYELDSPDVQQARKQKMDRERKRVTKAEHADHAMCNRVEIPDNMQVYAVVQRCKQFNEEMQRVYRNARARRIILSQALPVADIAHLTASFLGGKAHKPSHMTTLTTSLRSLILQ